MENNNYLERIAVALERIADYMDNNKNTNSISASNEPEITQDVHLDELDEGEIIVGELDATVIEDRLLQNGITVKCYPARDEENSQLNNISLFMGTRYNEISKVYDRIKRSLNSGKGFKADMKKFTQLEVSYSCQLCNMLYNIAFLSEYKYYKSPIFSISAKANQIPVAINFLTGHWLEIYIKETIREIINKTNSPIKYSYLINPQISLPNGDDFELDVLFMINDVLYWVEAKTGNYQNYINKYSRVSKLMKIDIDHAFLVLTDCPDNSSLQTLSKTYGMNVCSITNFQSQIEQLIFSDLNEQ